MMARSILIAGLAPLAAARAVVAQPATSVGANVRWTLADLNRALGRVVHAGGHGYSLR